MYGCLNLHLSTNAHRLDNYSSYPMGSAGLPDFAHLLFTAEFIRLNIYDNAYNYVFKKLSSQYFFFLHEFFFIDTNRPSDE